MKSLKHIAVFASYFLYSKYALLPLYLSNINVEKMSNDNYYLYLFFIDIIYIFIICFIYRKYLKEKLIDLKENYKKYIDIMIRVWIIGLFLMILSNFALSFIIPVDTPENESLINELFSVAPIYILWATVIYAPIVEEIIFRHSIAKAINTKWVFIFISGLVFGLSHVIYSAESVASLLYFIPYAFIGWSFAYMYKKTNNIFTAIGMHFLHNGILMGLMFLKVLVIR